MKITQNASIRPTTTRRAGKTSAGSSGQFTDHLVTGEAGAPTGSSNSSAPVSAVDSLLVLQEVPDATSGASKAKLRAEVLVDRLDEV